MIQLINRFFSTVKTYNDAIKFLNENKDYIHEPYNNIQTKKILFTLVIYKFNNEYNYPDKIKKYARNIILYFLDNSKYPKELLHKEILKYLREFDTWKQNDLDKLLLEITGSIVNLEEMKQNIIRKDTKSDIDNEWIEKINDLIKKINDYGNKLNAKLFKEKLDTLRLNIQEQKEKLAKDIIDDIYWTNFLETIKNNDYELLYNNFEEIKNILNEIKPEETNNQVIDINYLKQLIENNVFSPEYLSNYINYITTKLLKYGIPAYDHIVKDTRIKLIKNIDDNGLTPEIITNTFRFLMNMLVKLIEIIRIYRKHITK
jgi:hypothetical protein